MNILEKYRLFIYIFDGYAKSDSANKVQLCRITNA